MAVSASEVTVARIYLTEGDRQVEALLERLHTREQVRGVTLFRGIAGYGDSHKLHTSKWLDLSLDLPVVIEFFDTPEKMEALIERLGEAVKPGHMLIWNARVND